MVFCLWPASAFPVCRIALFLARGSIKTFLIFFLFACLNKETAVVLIPAFWFVCRTQYSAGKRFALIAGMLIAYVTIKLSISYAFRNNPGSLCNSIAGSQSQFVNPEMGLCWRFCVPGFLLLLLYEWQKKAYFLRVSFACVLLPLVGLSLFFGYLDEWRDYYEAYPIVLGIIVDTFSGSKHPSRVIREFRVKRKTLRLVHLESEWAHNRQSLVRLERTNESFVTHFCQL